MLDALRKRILTLVKRVDLSEHVLADVFEILLHLLEALPLRLVELGVLGVDDAIQTFNNIVLLFLIGLADLGESDVFCEVLELAVL